MPIPEDTLEFTPRVFRSGESTPLYWIRDETVMYLDSPLKGADVTSFRFYLGKFANDWKHCYCGRTQLAGGNGATFRALNYAYATDGQSVWTMGGKIEGVDAESFVVCDDGVHDLGGGMRAPYGYGKDKLRAFYYNFDGKANWVRKASPRSFVSLNDGHFGKDENFVFCGAEAIPKAKIRCWEKMGGYYSRDDARVFYLNREIRIADYRSFEVVPSDLFQLGRDKNNLYWNDRIVERAEFEDLLRSQ